MRGHRFEACSAFPNSTRGEDVEGGSNLQHTSTATSIDEDPKIVVLVVVVGVLSHSSKGLSLRIMGYGGKFFRSEKSSRKGNKASRLTHDNNNNVSVREELEPHSRMPHLAVPTYVSPRLYLMHHITPYFYFLRWKTR